MKKFYFVMALIIIASMILTACGSGCKPGDTDAECRARSPIDQQMKEFGQSSDIIIQDAGQALDETFIPDEEAVQEFDQLRDQQFQQAGNAYTNWALDIADAIFGPIP